MNRGEAHTAQKQAIRDQASRPTGLVPDEGAVARILLAEAAIAARHGTGCANITTGERAHHLIIAGLDDSTEGHLAVEQAALEARLHGWPLRIIHVRPSGRGSRSAPNFRTDGARLLADMAERIRVQEPEITATTELCTGSAAGELVKASHRAGLVVVGNRGRGGLTEFLTGSVASHVAGYANAPVLIVRLPAPTTGLDWLAHPIVVGVDGSPAGYIAFEFAVAEARLRGVGIVVVYASTAAPDDTCGPLHSGVLADVGASCLGVPIHRRWLYQDPRSALIGMSGHASAIIVGARGRGGFPGLHSGSVAQALIRQAHSPVFIIHDPDARRRPAGGMARIPAAANATE